MLPLRTIFLKRAALSCTRKGDTKPLPAVREQGDTARGSRHCPWSWGTVTPVKAEPLLPA